VGVTPQAQLTGSAPNTADELQWAIVADDLTGAADSASAFAEAGVRAMIALRADAVDQLAPAAQVLVVATNTRDRDAESAAVLCGEALTKLGARAPRQWFKKIDSTLRGHVALEVRLMLERIASNVALVAPAFPAAGRTVRGGRGFVHGAPLEESDIWRLQGLTGIADLLAMLEAGRLRTRLVTLDLVRSPKLQDTIGAAIGEYDAVVFDSEMTEDLVAIVSAARATSADPLWVGSAGLAYALSAAQAPVSAPKDSAPPAEGPIVVVVGSAATEARRQFERLQACDEIATERLSVDDLLSPLPEVQNEIARVLAEQLGRGFDLAIGIEVPARSQLDPIQAREVAQALASCVTPYRQAIGGLVLTGGDTAHAVLLACDIHGLHVAGGVEPGLPLSVSLPRSLPVVTKAGAFGDEEALRRALVAIRDRHT
jgi:uncharacterized protein YgbK (DUF1537 family)